MPKQTPFHPRTSALCTSLRWKEWAGYHAVRSYDTHPEREYHALRQAAGLLDVSPLCKYEIEGKDAASYLAWVSTRDLRRLRVGRVTYCCWCDAEGKVIDDGTIARRAEHSYRLTSASPLLHHLLCHSRGFDVTIADRTDRLAALALQGPTSRALLRELTSDLIDDMPFFGLRATTVAGVPVEITRTGYTGDLGYELWMQPEDGTTVWDELMRQGPSHGLLPAGLDALDVARIEAGFVLQDVDYFSAPRCLLETRKSSPFELGLEWTVELDRDPFVGRQALRTERERGSKWALVGLEFDWDALERLYDRHGLPPQLPTAASRIALPVYHDGRQVGQVTSHTWSPLLKKYLALATVERGLSRPGLHLDVEHTVEYSRERVTVVVVDRPFFDPPRKRSRSRELSVEA